MTTKNDKAPVRADDDGPELAAIAEQVRPVVDAGKGRALAFVIVAVLLESFRQQSDYLVTMFATLRRWWYRAQEIESGHEQEVQPVGQRLTLLDVAGMADRIASAAWCQARAGHPFPFERAIVLDIATALRRACGCDAFSEQVIRMLERAASFEDSSPWDVFQAGDSRAQHGHTANTLLPLLIRDARRLCAAAKVDVGPIEAAIARHGGRPS